MRSLSPIRDRLLTATISVLTLIALRPSVASAEDNADTKAPVRLLPGLYLSAEFLARRPDDHGTYRYKAKEVDDQIYFASIFPTAHKTPEQVATFEKLGKQPDHSTLELLRLGDDLILGWQTSNWLIFGPGAKVHKPNPIRYLAIDWTVEPPQVKLVDDLSQAATWKLVSREKQPEVKQKDQLCFPKGTYLQTHSADGVVYYMGLSHESIYRLTPEVGNPYIEMRRPILLKEPLWVFQEHMHGMKDSKLPEIGFARQADSIDNTASSALPQDHYDVTFFGRLLAPNQFDLSTLDGKPCFVQEWRDRNPAGDPEGKDGDDFKYIRTPSIRLYFTDVRNKYLIGWDDVLHGVGREYLAVDWSGKQPEVTTTRDPAQAVVWQFDKESFTSGADWYQHTGRLQTSDKQGAKWYLDYDAKPTSEQQYGGDRQMTRHLQLTKNSQLDLIYRAAVPHEVDGR